MRRFLIALSALAAGCTLASSAPALAATRNYDCSKPGNANKAVCKNAAAKPAKSAPAPKKETKAAAPKATRTAQAPKPAPAAKPAAKPAGKQAANERHYDCSKAGNANKAACKGAASAAVKTAPAKPAPAARPAAKPAEMPKAAPAAKSAPARTSAENNIAAGAIAQCKDGTYSHAKNHRGACSRHGGVGKWLG
jgi:large subunit ribosomal protein L22e/Meckel syndrome type 1 protein